ncbi:corticotropin-releasing factor receptor 2-like isoform X3 [Lethenteron reissneri]|uniref:corticotropin-releasing factor receptor 2-like isoform X3 n=1 Tax=Lethenteron reissneri TaxID=7753 RepID=UPI002AB6ACA2|nr:corticotropin-releasing factor receptor 2-like isoform X3 [Lethenteron reissneri]
MGCPPVIRDARTAQMLFVLLLVASSTVRSERLLCDGEEQANFTGPLCNATRDEIGTCWPESEAGRTVATPCPERFNGVRYDSSKSVIRECLANGTWAQRSNYSLCKPIIDTKPNSQHYKIALIVNYLGHCISLAALITAFGFFWWLRRSIRCLRNAIHWHLVTTFILRNAAWLLLQIIDLSTQERNEPWCRVVITVFNYFQVTNFFWMFVEGCYLHTAIVMTYSTDKLRKSIFVCIGWCIPAPIITVWAMVKLFYEDEKCWFGKTEGKYIDYIYQGPIILVLLEGGEGHAGAAAAAGNHLHAVLREPRGRPRLPGHLHLRQLLPHVLPGILCVSILLFPEWGGALCPAQALEPLDGQPPAAGARHEGHVHPHVAHAHQLPQLQAHDVRVTAGALRRMTNHRGGGGQRRRR